MMMKFYDEEDLLQGSSLVGKFFDEEFLDREVLRCRSSVKRKSSDKVFH